MSFLTELDHILNPEFIWSNAFFEEESASMKVELVNDGCTSLIFQLDKPLDRRYRGGLYPFFNNGNANVCKACDYIIFSEYKGTQYALIIEMKKGNQSTSEQIKAGMNFVDFVISTVNRVHSKNYQIVKRRISIKEVKRKRKTKIKDIDYDGNSHHLFEQNKFRTVAFLK